MNDLILHPTGETETTAVVPFAGPVAVDTFGGRVHVEWDPQAAVTPLGQLPFFTEFLHVSGLFDPWVDSCLLRLTSPNAPRKRDVLGTVMLSIKPLYGYQERAVKGYNPHKPGRPSHTSYTYFLSSLRLILDVEVKDGNQTASKYSLPGLWELLGRLPRAHWPALIRGDRDWGTQANMARAEQEGGPYLFKLRMTKGVKKTVERLMRGATWSEADQGWQGAETRLRLEGWSQARRTIVLRRQIKADLAMHTPGEPEQLCLSFAELTDDTIVYEYAVLVTTPGRNRSSEDSLL